MNIFEESVQMHQEHRGKWEMRAKIPLRDRRDLSLAYSPGVAGVSEAIAKDKTLASKLTMKGNSVAILSNGTAVLGLGDIGPEAAIPVMEGKAILFKEFADIDGIPIVTNLRETEQIISLVKAIAPSFGGINLEDIAAPQCFEIERALQHVGIPVFHDDQHGTAIVLLAALINSAKLVNKPIESMRVVINGAGAAGTAIASLLRCVGHLPNVCTPVKSVIVCDTKGIISRNREDLNIEKQALLGYTNLENRQGDLRAALTDADVFIGVSKGNLLTADHIKLMAPKALVFAMANPIPEIMPDVALQAGAAVVGTGRSDFPNQVNNVLAFPGIFRGALDAGAPQITNAMKIAAAYALADYVKDPSPKHILPDVFDKGVATAVAAAVAKAAKEDHWG